MKSNSLQAIMLIVVIMLTTMVVKVPLPTKGYFNFGDVAVVFSGLVIGSSLVGKDKFRLNGSVILLAFFTGGIGSALADVISGFAIFVPITFLAKALEAAFAAGAAASKGIFHYLLLAVGGIMMVLTYFLLESISKNIGIQLALSEIIPNLIQAAGGIIGGKIIFLALQKIEEKAALE